MLSASAADAPRTDPVAAARILVRGLAAEIRRAGFSRGVVGVSGGVDSAVALLLTARALGPEHVIAVALPVRGSAEASLADARAVAAAAGVPLRVHDLGDALAALEAALPGSGDDRLRRGNLAARLRMTALYDISAAERALVVGTSNKTEMLLGYSTQHGDAACAINPVGDLYKSEVRALARHLGVPEAVVAKPPTADLWPGQTDEDDLGFTYDDADRVLFQLVDMHRRAADVVAAGFPEALVRDLDRRIRTSAFKRRLPVILKVSARTLGLEHRLPRDAGT